MAAILWSPQTGVQSSGCPRTDEMKIWENVPLPSPQKDALDGVSCSPGPSHPCPSHHPGPRRGEERPWEWREEWASLGGQAGLWVGPVPAAVIGQAMTPRHCLGHVLLVAEVPEPAVTQFLHCNLEGQAAASFSGRTHIHSAARVILSLVQGMLGGLSTEVTLF